MKDKRIKYLIVTFVILFFVALISFGSYYYIIESSRDNDIIEVEEAEDTAKEYPEETTIEETEEENVKIITPSKEDTEQIENEEGELIEVPKLTPPPPPTE